LLNPEPFVCHWNKLIGKNSFTGLFKAEKLVTQLHFAISLEKVLKIVDEIASYY